MLPFAEEYFKTEVRDGFTIYELMKRCWAAQLEVLHKIIEICDKYHLTYYAYWGTLLGTVRHQGFIPWDDDLDIAMKKEDYIKFLEVAKQELPEEYRVFNSYTEMEYENVFTRVTNGDGLDLSDDRMIEYHGCPFVVGIDIFPLYYVPRDETSANEQKMILEIINNVITLTEMAETQNQVSNNAVLAEGLVGLERITGYQFTTDRPISNQLNILYDQVCRLFDEQESDELAIFPHYMKYGYKYDKFLFAESIQMPFENISLNVPNGYDAILTKIYKDYMTPKQVRASHDYPFYQGMLAVWGRYIEKDDCRWKEQQKLISGNFCENQTDEKTGMLLPKEWMEKIYTDGGGRKKIILYHTSADALMCHGAYVLSKLKYVFDTFRETQNVVIWWFPCILDNPNFAYFQKMVPQLLIDYRQMIEEFQKENVGIFDDSGDMQRAVAMADAYFGDESDLLQLFKENGKPIMLQDYEIGE